MPFPPTFTDVWDITQPPDTQFANLLGADLRNLKLDIMQRLSLLSGTLANRPTPETVNATWGGSGFGLLYFATDVQLIYQWTGGGWNVVQFNQALKLFDGTIYSGTGSTGGNQLTITPVSGSTIHGVAWGAAGAGAGVPQVSMALNGNTLTGPINVNAGGNWRVDYDIEFLNTAQVKTNCLIYALGTGSFSVEASYSGLVAPYVINAALTNGSGPTVIGQTYQYTLQYP